MPKTARPIEVCVLSRFHSAKSVSMLDTALFSLLGQDGVRIRSVVLCQDLEAERFAEVKAVCDRYRELGLDTTCTNERFDDDGDHRAELLNRGIARCKSQFLAFLDCDDVVYPGIYSALTKRLKGKSAAVAFGGCVRADYYKLDGVLHFTNKSLLFQSLPAMRFFSENQYPIHSYVIDMSKVDKDELFFDKAQCRNEDYAFLFRILRKYESDDFCLTRKMCEYRVDIGGSNTIMAFGADSDSIKAWAVADDYMDAIRRDSRITVDYEDIVEFAEWLAKPQPHAKLESANERAKKDMYRSRLTALVSSWEQELRQLDFHIDSVESSDHDHVNVSGWLHGNGDRPFFAVCLGANGEQICDWDEFQPREDVATSFGLKSSEVGFTLKIPDDHDMIRIKCLTYENECFVSPLFSLREKLR